MYMGLCSFLVHPKWRVVPPFSIILFHVVVYHLNCKRIECCVWVVGSLIH